MRFGVGLHVSSARGKHARETLDVVLFLPNDTVDRLLIGAPDGAPQLAEELERLLLKTKGGSQGLALVLYPGCFAQGASGLSNMR